MTTTGSRDEMFVVWTPPLPQASMVLFLPDPGVGQILGSGKFKNRAKFSRPQQKTQIFCFKIISMRFICVLIVDTVIELQFKESFALSYCQNS